MAKLTYICCQCEKLLDDPYRLSCGDNICWACIMDATKADTVGCRRCGKETPRYQIQQDKQSQDAMKQLPTQCTSCRQTMPLKDYQKHLTEEHGRNLIAHVDGTPQANHAPFVEDAQQQQQENIQLAIMIQQAFQSFQKPTITALQNDPSNTAFIWKISSFREKMMDAQSERQTSIYSPPFYSSPTGYKMRARLYLHGDGNARGSHMSLFFVLMRGPNDAILKFPFTHTVSFCLYHQTDPEHHVIHLFRPDASSGNFQRPQAEMNIASGFPMFLPLSLIETTDSPYVRHDTMFIKIMVHPSEISDETIKFALTLN